MDVVVKRQGNILNEDVDAIVIPVNCEGVHGKGLAKEWATKYKGAAEYYRLLCSLKYFKVGRVFPAQQDGKWFLCFPTKDLWRLPSKLEYIESGLQNLMNLIGILDLKSIAIPALGCGLGGLAWEDVYPIIREELEYLESEYNLDNNFKVIIYEPR